MIDFTDKIILAPMAGICDLPFRLLCKEQGCDIVYTEMISAKGMYYNNKNTEPLLMTDDKEKGSKVVRSSIWYTIANVSIRAVAIITTPIYTGMLTTADYGKANTFNSWIDVFNVFACLCVVYSIGRAKLDFPDKFDEYMSSLQGLSSSFGFILLILAFIFRESLSGWIHYEVPLAVGLFAYLCVSPSVEYMMQKCRYEYRYKENILISVITCVGQVALSILLMLLFNDRRYIGKILGVMLPTAIMGIIFYIRFIVKGRVFYNKEYWIYAQIGRAHV